MNFFHLDQANKSIVGTPEIWIFFASSGALTAVTFLLYYWLLRWDGNVFRGLVPKVKTTPAWSIQALKRQFTSGTNADLELQCCEA